jgi:hypothetical protein
MQYSKHYSTAEANALLPLVRRWLERLTELRESIRGTEERLAGLLQHRQDLGGRQVNEVVRKTAELQEVLAEFYRREIQLKDLDRGLIDFPAIVEGKEVFLCWEQGEKEIEFWHALDAGYAGREPL